MSKSREVQQKQVNAITKELKRLGVDETKIKEELHDVLHGNNYNYQEALQAAKDHFGVAN